MATRNEFCKRRGFAAILYFLMALSCAGGSSIEAAMSTLVDNGNPDNRVDVIFVGDGYTQSELDSGLYARHVENYLDYMFGAPDFLADPFPRYHKFFNVHAIDVVSAESGADKPPQGIFRNTALDASYWTAGNPDLLAIDQSKANMILNQNLNGTGITADIRLATVNDTQYGGSGGLWAVFAGANPAANEVALHELSHAFSATADEYVAFTAPFPGPEPAAVNVTTEPSGQKWEHWHSFEDPRADYLDVGVFEGAAFYSSGVYRSTLDSKMRTLNRPFNAVVREQTILDIYNFVRPLDDLRDNSNTIVSGNVWVEVVDPDVIRVDWYVDDQLVAEDHGESFDLADFTFPTGVYEVRALAYDTVLEHAGDGTLLDLVRVNLGVLQQEVEWVVDFTANPPLAGDYNGDGEVNATDYSVWKSNFGSTSQLDADGNRNGIVDAADYTVWRNSTGGGMDSSVVSIAAPEPSAIGVLTTLLLTGCARSRPRRAIRGAVFSHSRRI